MDNTQLHILLLQEANGTISPEDQYKLDQILRASEQARSLKALVNASPGSANEPALKADVWASIESRAEAVNKRARIRSYYIAATLIVTLLASGIWLAIRITTPGKLPVAATGPIIYDNAGLPILLTGTETQDIGESKLEFRSGKTVIVPSLFDTTQRTLVVPVTSQADMILADGTRILVNADTEVRLPLQFGSQSRQIQVTGEAWLEVAPDAIRPFIVRTPGNEIKVLGTQFAVRTFGSASTEISLSEGALLVISTGDSIRLAAGEKLTMTPGRIPVIVSLDSTYDLSWTTGRYKFFNPTVAELGNVLHRWFDMHLLTSIPTSSRLNIRGMVDRSSTVAQNIQRLNEIGTYQFRMSSNNIIEVHNR